MSRIERFFSPPEIGAPGRSAGRRRRRDFVLAGLFVVLMTAALALALYVVSGGIGKTYGLHTDFDTAAGLKAGTPVEEAGYVIGAVGSVAPIFEPGSLVPRFRIVLKIKRAWRIPADSRAFIAAAGLLQGNVVKIVPGQAVDALAPGQRIESGGVEPDAIAQLAGLLDYLRPILTSLNKQIEALESFMVAGDTPDQSGNLGNVSEILENLRAVSERLAGQAAAIDPESVMQIVTSARDAAEDLARLVDTLEKPARDMERVLENIGTLGSNLNRVVEDNEQAVQTVVAETQYMTQQLSTALNPILDNIDGATRNLLELSREIRDNPAVIVTGRKTTDNTPSPAGKTDQ
jgi:phospholipid/cholesterol/gamma-HCH transport system substrate-binding protein